MPELFGFTLDQAAKLTGLSSRQLGYWSKTGFFPPGFMEGKSRGLRLYTFRDIVGLRALAELRKTHHISLQELRKTARELAKRHETPWASLTLYVAGQGVFFDDPESGAVVSTRPGSQTALRVELTQIARDVQAAVDQMRSRTPAEIGKVDQKRNVSHNQPVIAGTRVPTTAVWNLHEDGFSVEAIRGEYPQLTDEDVQAALAYELGRHAVKAG